MVVFVRVLERKRSIVCEEKYGDVNPYTALTINVQAQPKGKRTGAVTAEE